MKEKITENRKSIVIGIFVVLVLILGFFFGRDILNNDEQVANVIESDLFTEEMNESENDSSDGVVDSQWSMTEVINGVTYYKKVMVPVLASPDLFDYAGTKTVACGEEIVWATADVEPTRAPLTASINNLLNSDKDYGFEPGNFLAGQEDISLIEVLIEDSIAKIYLEGEFSFEDDCDSSRVFTQLEEVSLQYYSVNGVQIFLNGELVR